MSAFFFVLFVVFAILFFKQKKEFKALLVKIKKVEDADAYFSEQREILRKDSEAAATECVQMKMQAEAERDEIIKQAEKERIRISKRVDTLTEEHDRIQKQSEALIKEVSRLKEEISTLENVALVKMTSVELTADIKSDEIKNKLALLKNQQDDLVKNGKAAICTAPDMSTSERNKQLKQLLRCFNSECAEIIGSVTVKNIDSSRNKIQRSFAALNKLFEVDSVHLTEDYLASRLEELSLAYSYQVKREEEAEQRKAIREQMVEEEKVRREIERAKQQIEKDRQQFSQEVNRLMGYMQKATDEIEKKLYIDKITEIESKLKTLEEEEKNVLDREQNARAGFVYIISNIGSFGEQVFKIGMTRRLEPMDRISELSSASVPFPFDVHAMIFSEDAPALETTLHQYFQSNQVNKVNSRKEFFRVNLDEIKKVVLKNHNATVQFIDEPDAIEYRETLKLA